MNKQTKKKLRKKIELLQCVRELNHTVNDLVEANSNYARKLALKQIVKTARNQLKD